jgi:hypothetical protein
VWAAEQAKKAADATPPSTNRAEQFINRLEGGLLEGRVAWHPFFDNAYAGGGFTVGAGRAWHVSSYNVFDVRGSYTPKGYIRLEAEFLAPRLFHRRATLSVIGGWREATEVGFYGFGAGTSKDDRANYSFRQPYLISTFSLRPRRGPFVIGAGLELNEWQPGPGEGSEPSVDEIYTPETLPGLGSSPTYVHSQGSLGFDWRTAPGYTRRGGSYTATYHHFLDRDGQHTYQQYDYVAIQHVPILRDAWVLSLRGHLRTTDVAGDQAIPFFMMPALGGGSTLRGFSSWRFQDRHTLLVSAEWRVLINRFLDTALFYDSGRVAARRSDLDFDHLENNVGIGVRFHGYETTPLRIELAHSREGWKVVFASKGSF